MATKSSASSSPAPPSGVLLSSCWFHTRLCSTMPMTTPVSSATGRLLMRATTAAASALSSRLGPNCEATWNVDVGRTRMAVSPLNAPAIIHASVDMRAANTPDRRAASGFSDAARRASPKRLRRRNTVRPITTSGTMTSMPTCAGLK